MNRSNGCFIAPKFQDFAIIIRIDDNGGCEQIIINETSRRFALGKAFDGRKGQVLFCKTAEEMTYDERGQWDMSLPEDKIREARENADRRMGSWSQLDMY